MKYAMLLVSFVIIAIGAIFGVAFRNDLFGVYLFALSGFAVFVPATIIIGLIVMGLVLARRRPWKAVSYGLVVCASCMVALYVSMETGSEINRSKIDAVEEYVARAVPILDGIKQKEGSYPSKLPTDILGDPPEFLQNYGTYSSDGSTFRFEYVDEPAGWAGDSGAIEFDSTTRKWGYDR